MYLFLGLVVTIILAISDRAKSKKYKNSEEYKEFSELLDPKNKDKYTAENTIKWMQKYM